MSIRYVDDPFEDDDKFKRKPPKKLFGTTDLQKLALNATRRKNTGFTDNRQLKAFRAIEVKAEGADSESRMWAAWMKYRIEETARLNTKWPTVGMDELIRRMASDSPTLERRREIWFTENRAKVLKKLTPEELSGKVDGLEEMTAIMEKRIAERKEDD